MEAGSFVVTLFSVALMIVVWYSLLRYKRQFAISTYLAWILLILAIVDALTRQSIWPVFTAAIAALSIAMLQVEKNLRLKKERESRAATEANEVE